MVLSKGKVIFSAFLTLVVLSASMYFIFNSGDTNFKVDIQETKTLYYTYYNNSQNTLVKNGTEIIEHIKLEPIYENLTSENGTIYQNIIGYNEIKYNETKDTYVSKFIKDEYWKLRATEYVYLYDGSTKMRASSRNLSWYNDTNYVYATRKSTWKDNITTIQTYKFKINETNIENVPIENKLVCINCEDKFIQFEIRDINYSGETMNIESGFSFDENMNIEFDEFKDNDDFAWAKVYQQKTDDKIIVKYRANEPYEEYYVRVYDPPLTNLTIGSGETITLGGDQSYDVVNISSGGKININSTVKYLNIIANKVIINGVVNGTYLISGGASRTIVDYGSALNGYDGTDSYANTGGNGGKATWSGNAAATSGGSGAGGATTGTSTAQVKYGVTANGASGGSAAGSSSNNTDKSLWFGSGGASGGAALGSVEGSATSGVGGTGAGYISISAPIIDISNSIFLFNGTNGGNGVQSLAGSGSGGGGGSGGTILIDGLIINATSSILSVAGGNGGSGAGGAPYSGAGSGGAGSGGRIKIFGYNYTNTSITINNGTGSYYFEKIPDSITVDFLTPNTPLNNSLLSSPEISINLDVFNLGTTVLNVTYNLYNSTYNLIESITFSNETYEYNFTDIEDGNYSFNVTIFANSSVGTILNTSTDTRFVGIDITVPVISILYPEDLIYSTEITTLNSTQSDLNLDSCWYSLDELNTNTTFTCNTNITGLSSEEGYNTWYVCANDTVGNIACEDVIFGINTISPTINVSYPLNETYFNKTINELNYTAESIFPDSCWYSNDGGITNSTIITFGDNFTISPIIGENTYVIYCNSTSGLESSNSTTFYIYDLNFTINNDTIALDVELGSHIDLNASISLNNVTFDVPPIYYGLGNSLLNSTYNLIINFFRKVLFANNLTSFEMNVTETDNSTGYLNLTINQYDIIDNLTFNLSGNTEDTLIGIYDYNLTTLDKAYFGYLNGSDIFINSFYDTELEIVSTKNMSYETSGPNFINILMDYDTTLANFVFNLIGNLFGFAFEDNYTDNNYTDSIKTTARKISGAVIPAGYNPMNFTYDTFDSSIDTTKWDFNHSDGSYYSSGDPGSDNAFIYDFTGTESSTSIKMGISNFIPMSDVVGTKTAQEQLYVNNTLLNLYTPISIQIGLKYNVAARVESFPGQYCTVNNLIGLGSVGVYQTPWSNTCMRRSSYDPNVYFDCYTYSDSGSNNITVKLDNNFNGSWNVTLGGSATISYVYEDLYFGYACGNVVETYNYTAGTFTRAVSSTPYCSIGYGTTNLSNRYTINDINLFPLNSVIFQQDIDASYWSDDNEGCRNVDNSFEILYINQTLLNLTNSSYYSSNIFNSGNTQISKVNMSLEGSATVLPYVSSNDGLNYTSATPLGSYTTISETGTDIKYYYTFNVGEGGYVTDSPYISKALLSTEESYPTNISVDIGNNGVIDYTMEGELNETNSPIMVNVSNLALDDSFFTTRTVGDLYNLPIKISSTTAGIINISDINISYNPNPIRLNVTNIQNYINALNRTTGTGFLNLPIKFLFDGNLTANDLKYDYAGGSFTFGILARSLDYIIQKIINVTYYFTRWDYDFYLDTINSLEFIPLSPTSKNVSAYGQTTTKPIIVLTNYGYHDKNATISVRLSGLENETVPANSCVNLTVSTTNNKSQGIQLNTTFQDLLNDTKFLTDTNLWMWADYGCNYSTWRSWEPNFYVRYCCEGCICSETLI